MYQCSLILVTHNSAALLPAFVAALPPQTEARYELIVVDSASADGSTALAASLGARVIGLAENVGFGRACNRGAAAATGERLLFLNPDVQLLPGCLKTLLEHSAANPDALLAPQTLDRGATARRPRDHPSGDDRSIPSRGWWAGNQSGMANPSALLVPSAALPGRALLVPRAVWDALGGFDERIFLYWEDTELCWRAWLLGFRALEVLDAAVTHPRGGGAGWDAQRLRHSVYTHLKLSRWRVTLPFLARQLAVTALKLLRTRDLALLRAWAWQIWNIGGTLAQRAKIQRRRAIEPGRLEQLMLAHAVRQRRERAARG